MGAFSGCFSLILGFVRCIMLNGYQKHSWIRWYGWSFIFSAGFLAILYFSWGGMASEMFTMGSILVSIVRFGWRNLFDEDSAFQN